MKTMQLRAGGLSTYVLGLVLVLAGTIRVFAACGTLQPLRPSNTALVVSDVSGVCGSPGSSCNFGQTLTFTLQTFGPDLTCVPHNLIWDFGDGTQASTTSTATTHVYAHAGVYTARVIVTGADTTQLDGSGSLTLSAFLALPATVPAMSVLMLLALACSLALAGLLRARLG
jgi:hypothetical protein